MSQKPPDLDYPDVGRQCRICRWWQGTATQDTHSFTSAGDCRRHAPERIVGSGGDETRVFPRTREDDWCGDWEYGLP